MVPKLVPPLGSDVSEQALVRLFVQKTEDRSAPGKRKIQGSQIQSGSPLEPECQEVKARILRFTGGCLSHNTSHNHVMGGG